MFQIASHILAYSNSCINPILYAFLSPPFRAGFVKLLPCTRPRGAVEETVMLARMKARETHNIEGSLLGDATMAWCCTLCSSVQTANQEGVPRPC